MKNRKPRKNHAAVLVRADLLERILARVHEADQKLDYLIKNLRRCNIHSNHCNHTLSEFMG